MLDSLNTVLQVLVFANTIALLLSVVMIAVMLVRMNVEISKFIDIQMSIAELTKVVEQQSRLLEYIRTTEIRH